MSCRFAALIRGLCLIASIVCHPGVLGAQCASPVSPGEFLDCAQKNDPVLAEALAEVLALEAQAGEAGTWKNPVADGSLRSGPDGSRRWEAALTQELPLSGSAAHAGNAAAWKAQAARARFQSALQQRLADWVVDLARLRQIDEELALVGLQEGLGRQALARLGRIRFLTTEQEAARHTFQWNQNVLEAARLKLRGEAGDLRQGLGLSLGHIPTAWDFVLPHREEWPAFPAAGPEPSPGMKALEFDAQGARSSLSLARAGAWPEIVGLGPVLESEEGPAGSEVFAGVGLSLGLPLWNRARGERKAESARLEAARNRLQRAPLQYQARLELLKTRYTRAVPVLKKYAHGTEEGVPILKSIQASYLAGRLPVSSALEAFRQYSESVEQNHALERQALQDLWQAYALTGTALGRKP